jgi:hypothetical protein
MSATVLYMSMSLDGFVAGPNEGPGKGLGDGGHRLHEWSFTDGDADNKEVSGRLASVNGKVVDEFHGDRGGRRRPEDLRAGRRLGR